MEFLRNALSLSRDNDDSSDRSASPARDDATSFRSRTSPTSPATSSASTSGSVFHSPSHSPQLFSLQPGHDGTPLRPSPFALPPPAHQNSVTADANRGAVPPSTRVGPGFSGPLSLPFPPAPGEGRFYMVQKVKMLQYSKRAGSKGHLDIEATGDVWLTHKRLIFTSPSITQASSSHLGTVMAHVELPTIQNECFASVSKKSSRLCIRFDVPAGSAGAGSYAFEQVEKTDIRALSLAKFFMTLLDNLFLHRFQPCYVQSNTGEVFVRQAFVDPDTFKVAYFDVPFCARHFAYAGIESGCLHLAQEAPPADGIASAHASTPAYRPGFVAALKESDQERLERNMRQLQLAFVRHSRPGTLRTSSQASR